MFLSVTCLPCHLISASTTTASGAAIAGGLSSLPFLLPKLSYCGITKSTTCLVHCIQRLPPPGIFTLIRTTKMLWAFTVLCAKGCSSTCSAVCLDKCSCNACVQSSPCFGVCCRDIQCPAMIGTAGRGCCCETTTDAMCCRDMAHVCCRRPLRCTFDMCNICCTNNRCDGCMCCNDNVGPSSRLTSSNRSASTSSTSSSTRSESTSIRNRTTNSQNGNNSSDEEDENVPLLQQHRQEEQTDEQPQRIGQMRERIQR